MKGASRVRRDRCWAGVGFLAWWAGLAGITFFWASRPATAQNSETAEVTTQETQPSFQLHVQRNEVLLRVVVRNAQGHVITSLQKDDFRVFDNRKPQLITHFALEKGAGANPPGTPAVPAASNASTANPATPVITLPRRFMALFFDDIHLVFGDLARTRDAAGHYLGSNLRPGDRVALFTSSGQDQLDFTDDPAKLREALLRLQPRPIYQSSENDCPQIFPYQAYKIVDQQDTFAIATAHEEAYQCDCLDTGDPSTYCQQSAYSHADAAARQAYEAAQNQSIYALRALEGVCRRMAAVPGQRSIVLVSPGFLTITRLADIDELVDRALRDHILISSLDARGLYTTIPLGDATQRPVLIPNPALEGDKVQTQIDSMERDADVLAEVAEETGGNYFHNSNDFAEGFREVGAFPEAYYVLAFTPENLKLDGRFHTLKVTLNDNSQHFAVQTRRGYFAPDKAADTAKVAKEELEQMIFSQEELNTIPVEVRTQFFKPQGADAKLSVLTRLDIRGVRFHKADGRNLNNLTVVTALFDLAGNYVTGQQKRIEFHLRDSTLDKLAATGLNMKSSFSVKTGTYLVREVVQDQEGDQVSALNRTVEIP
jgi:VWFA-related protein